MNIEYLIQLVRNQNLDVGSKSTCSEALLRTLFQRMYCDTVLAELSKTRLLEDHHLTKAFVATLQYGITFQRQYRAGSPNPSVFRTAHSVPYLAINESIFEILRLHKEGKTDEIIDCSFSRLVNTLSALAEIKGFNMETSIASYFRNGSNSALSESAGID